MNNPELQSQEFIERARRIADARPRISFLTMCRLVVLTLRGQPLPKEIKL